MVCDGKHNPAFTKKKACDIFLLRMTCIIILNS